MRRGWWARGWSALPAGLLFLASCQGGQSATVDNIFKGNAGAAPPPIPNAVTGGLVPRGGSLQASETKPPEPSRAELESRARSRLAQADALWCRAEQLDEKNPAAAADVFQDIADDYPETPRAAEARYREGRARVRAADWVDGYRALKSYMDVAPVNPHLAEVEELIYRAGVQHLRTNHGIGSIFTSDEPGIEALRYVPEAFPAGSYADDALLGLADWYMKDEEDYTSAALHYRELLLRYPDSEWAYRAMLGLGDAYFAMDQGDPYNAGYVDIDPREPPQGEKGMIFGGDVKSAVEAAYEQYGIYIERAEADPARAAEYPQELACARAKRTDAARRLTAKDLHRAALYRSKGHAEAARMYQERSCEWIPAGRPGTGVAAPAPTPGEPPPVVPPIVAPVVAPPVVPPSGVPPPAPVVVPPPPPQPVVPPPTPTPTRPPVAPPRTEPTAPPSTPPGTLPAPSVRVISRGASPP